MSVSTDPRGAIIPQWLVKTRKPVSQGHTSEEEAEQKQWEGMMGIYRIMIEGMSAIHPSTFNVIQRGVDNWGLMEHLDLCNDAK